MAGETQTYNWTVAALFENPDAAHGALAALQRMGFDPARISYLRRQAEAVAKLEPPSETNALIKPEEWELAESPVIGAISGGVLGGSLGWLVGLALLSVPGIGPVLSAGTLAALIASAATGAALGGLGGALLMWGAPENEAHHYAAQLHGDRVLVAVEVGPDEEKRVGQLLEQAGGFDVKGFDRRPQV